MPVEKYGRVLVDSSSINIIAAGGGLGGAAKEQLVSVLADDHLGIRAGANGAWAAVRFVFHETQPQSLQAADAQWEESMEVVVTYSDAPFIYVDFSVGYGVEETLQDLGLEAGTYAMRVSAKGLRESFAGEVQGIAPLELAAPPDELTQQFRVDVWPTEDPYQWDQWEGITS